MLTPHMGADPPAVLQLEGELPAGARAEGNVLTLPAVRHEDAGVYACAATNARGRETAYYVLKVRGEDRRMDKQTGRVGGDVLAPLLTPLSPQSTWSPISGRRRTPSSPCPPSRTPTRDSRLSSPSDLTLPMVSVSPACPLLVPCVSPACPLCVPRASSPCPLHIPSILSSSILPLSLLYLPFSTQPPPSPLMGVSPPSWGCFVVPMKVTPCQGVGTTLPDPLIPPRAPPLQRAAEKQWRRLHLLRAGGRPARISVRPISGC